LQRIDDPCQRARLVHARRGEHEVLVVDERLLDQPVEGGIPV